MPEATTIAVPSGPFTADVVVPGDKSLGHRALILGAIAEGRSRIGYLPDGADIASTRRVLEGVGIRFLGDTLDSPGFDSWVEPVEPLDCGNSGTTMRLMAGALAGTPFHSVLVGDPSLSSRPMSRLAAPLGLLGARIETTDGTAPLVVVGSPLTGADVPIPLPSAQVRTAVAFAALHASGPTTIDSPPGFRDHTEHWLASLGRGERMGPTRLLVEPGPIAPLDVTIPGDPSSAAYLWATASVRPGSRVVTRGVSLNSGRLGFLRLLSRMGVEVTTEITGQILGDPIGDVTVQAAALRGISVERDEVAAAIDELPLLAVVAAAAEGSTIVTGAAELRVKESDRLAGAVDLALVAGRSAAVFDDGFIVHGDHTTAEPRLDSRDDHRIAMAGAVATAVRREPIEITSFEACAVSWPGFRDALEGLWS